jgi:hypothetical protein
MRCFAMLVNFFFTSFAPPLIFVELLAAGNGTIAKLWTLRKDARCARATYSLRILSV